jgi:hypothetical protein
LHPPVFAPQLKRDPLGCSTHTGFETVMMLTRLAHGLVALLLVLLAACDGDPAAPTVEEVVGNYHATTLTTQEAGTTTDHLAAGASITLTLNAGLTTAGRLFVPGGNEDGSDFDADLTGSWTLTGRTVNLEHATDTFLRDMPLIADGSRLTGQATFSGVTVRVVLSK